MKIAIISSSVRTGRNSHRVALFLKNYMETNKVAAAELLDLLEYNFPIFEERLKFQKNPSEKAKSFAQKIVEADGVIIVTPEYNGGVPPALKNVIDLLTSEWNKKPVAFSTVSAGAFGGSQSIISIQFSLWKQKALTVPVVLPIPKVAEAFTEKGEPLEKENMEKRTKTFIDELVWYVKAKEGMGREVRS